MMTTTLIVARMEPADAPAVAGIFAESDATDLPGMVGVHRRRLFRYQGLYFHLFETAATGDGAPMERVDAVRRHPLFDDVNRKLATHVTPYDPQTWASPRDAVAEIFYDWSDGTGRRS